MKRKVLAVIISMALLVPQSQIMIPRVSAAENVASSVVKANENISSANVIVDASYTGQSGDLVNGRQVFKTVKEAFDSVPADNSSQYIIYIKNGTYKEKLTLNKPYVTLIGEDAEKTILTYDAAHGLIKRTEDGGNGTSTYGTTGSASLTVGKKANGFAASNITFENSYDEAAHPDIKDKQAVAFLCQADESVLTNCRFIGNQDTLYAKNNKQYYENCYIEGDVDFVFGAAQAVFENCELCSLERDTDPKGYVTAPNTIGNNYGYLFENCNLTNKIQEPATVYLGRAWRDATDTQNSSEAVFKNCTMGSHIKAEGWSVMGGDGSLPQDNRLYEYGSTGVGAATVSSDTRKVLTNDEAAAYTKENFLAGFDPSAKVSELSELVKKNTTESTVEKRNEAEDYEWHSTRFGATTSEKGNQIDVDKANKTVTITSGNKEGTITGGKVTGANDGMSYYYTEIDPSKNFEISADVKVNFFEKPDADNQAGFGIMARDVIGVQNDESLSPSNMVMVGGYKSTISSVMRTGVTSDYSERITMVNYHKFSERPVNDGTATYKLTLKKTNTGYIASVDNGEEVTYYKPKNQEVMNKDKIYLGFFTARVASITVSNVNLTTSDVATDPAGVPDPTPVIKPSPSVLVKSSSTTGASKYDLNLKANIKGKAKVLQEGKEIYNGDISGDDILSIPTELSAGDNNFDITYTAEDGTVVNKTQNVNYKHYGTEDGKVYIANDGTTEGDGTEGKPLDIYTAMKYTFPGEQVKVKGGVYKLTSRVNISQSGNKDNVNTFESYGDERVVFDSGNRNAGLSLSGSYWNLKGFDSCNNTGCGLSISGKHNVVEDVKVYNNKSTGLQISGSNGDAYETWPADNLILNCEAYDNRDASENNADGFAAKIAVGDGNVFRGCIGHNNCDDGWDLFSKYEVGKIGAVLIEDCIAYGNGTMTDGTKTKGDGNGFKLGGEGIPVKHTLKNSLSFKNNAAGISGNSNPACVVEGCTSVDNNVNISLDYYTGAVLDYELKDNMSLMTNGGEKDNIPDMVLGESNYYFNGTDTENSKGEKKTVDELKNIKMPKSFDSNGNENISDYIALRGNGVKNNTAEDEDKPVIDDNNKPGTDEDKPVIDDNNTGSGEDKPIVDDNTAGADENKASGNDNNSAAENNTLGNNDSQDTKNHKLKNTKNTAKTGDAGVLGLIALAGVSLAETLKRKRK